MLALILTVYLLLQISFIQTKLAQWLAHYWGNQLKTEIRIAKVELQFLDRLTLEGLYIEDLNKDTLFYINRLELHYLGFNAKKNKIKIPKITLVKPTINIIGNEQGEMNYDFISNYFGSSEDTGSFVLVNNNLIIDDGVFHFHDAQYQDTVLGANYDHVDFSHLSINAKDMEWTGEKISLLIDQLSFHEENGFTLKNLQTAFTWQSSEMNFYNLLIETENTHVRGEYHMIYDSPSSFSDYNNEVAMRSNFDSSIVFVPDLAFFVPELEGINSSVEFTGAAIGTVANLRCKNIDLVFDKETKLIGDLDFRGFPNIEETFMFLDLKELSTNSNGLRNLPYPPFETQNHLTVPTNFDELGQIKFSGEFTGFYNDFVAYGLFQTEIGQLKTDLALTENDLGKFNYNGEINTIGFDIGQFFGSEQLGSIAFNLSVEGQGVTSETIDAKAKGKIQRLSYANYLYKDIDINGSFSKQKFLGILDINDKNLVFNFDGLIDFSTKNRVTKFNLNLLHSNLANLNLFNRSDTNTTLSFKAEMDLEGGNLDDLIGTATIKMLNYSDSIQNYQIDSLLLLASKQENSKKLELISDLIDAEIQGDFNLANFPKVFQQYLKNKIPESYKELHSKQKFTFLFNFKNVTPITQILLPELSISKGTVLKGSFNAPLRKTQIDLYGNKIGYKEYVVEMYKLGILGSKDSIRANLNSTLLGFAEGSQFENSSLDCKFERGLIETHFVWDSINNAKSSGDFNFGFLVNAKGDIDVSFSNSSFILNDSLWVIEDSSKIQISDHYLSVQEFNLNNSLQFFKADGVISENLEDTLSIELNQLNLSYLSALFPNGEPRLEGVADGIASLTDYYGNFSLTSDLSIKNLSINEVKIGTSELLSTWNPSQQSLDIDAEIGENESNSVSLKGKIYPLKEEDNLALSLNLNKMTLEIFKPYLQGYLSDLEGNLDGSIAISGSSKKPLLKGVLNLQKTRFKVDYLNSYYSIDDKIVVENDFFGFNLIEIEDENGKKAISTGTIFHTNFSKFNYDIGLDFTNFLAINNSKINNDLYYGKGVVSGNGNIAGYDDQLVIELDLITEKGTDISIPLSDGVEVSQSDYLIFVNDHTKITSQEESIDLSGISLDIDLDIRPEAKVQIIFDEQIGDILRGTGTGLLKLEINPQGDFNIFGQYIVQEGDYLFTLQNVINKKFEIANGSRIAWDGDPYGAVIDIKAVYSLRASLFDIMPDDTTSNLRRRVPIELELLLTNKLLSPDIDFKINMPTADDNTRRRLESILYLNSNDVNRQEMNQQVFGLLMLGRFLTPTSGVTDGSSYDRGAPGLNNGYEFLSNQLSNWLSNVSDQFDIGVNYRPADAITNDELDLSLSTQVFNDRLVLDGNLGYSSQNSVVNNQNSNFIGEFAAEYKLNKDGKLRLKGFNRSTNNNLLQNNSPYTQGIGLFYREDFDSLSELWRKYFHAE